VTGAIDQLLARVHEALLHERTLTADAAHELRTPLAALRAQAQVAYRAADPAERATALTDLLLSVDRTARVVDAVLTLARYDARSREQLAQSCVFMDRLAHLVADEFLAPAAAAGIRIQVDSDGAGALGDEDALAVVLRNLVGNALRFASRRIDIVVRAEAPVVRITVRDDGPGIPAALSQRIFQRFFRGSDGARNPEVGVGAGLGLAIVRRIVDLHAGSIRLVPGIGSGAGIEIELPAGKEPRP
jgi:signal transduction histidine kinase